MSRSSADKRDIYYRLCKSEGYRARSAYKLLHLDEEFSLFRGVKTACDFCAAPGSWSQVLTRKLRPKGALGVEDVQIVSVDLQPMAPLPHVTTLHADITVPSTVDLMLSHMNGRKADLIVCDGAPEVTGVHDLDAYLHGQLLIAAFTLALPLLAPHSTLIFKVFLPPMDPKGEIMMSQYRSFFEAPAGTQVDLSLAKKYADGGCTEKGYDAHGRPGGVWIRKPRSSRAGSAEHFLVCRNFAPSALPSDVRLRTHTTSGEPITSLSLDALEVTHSHTGLSNQQIKEQENRWKVITRYAMGDLTPWDDLFPKQNIDTNSESEPDGMFDSFVHTLINPARKARLWTLACYPLIFLLGLPWWWHTTSVERLDLPLAGVNGMAEGVLNLPTIIHLSTLSESPIVATTDHWLSALSGIPASEKNGRAWQIIDDDKWDASTPESTYPFDSGYESGGAVLNQSTTDPRMVLDFRPCREQSEFQGCVDGIAGKPFITLEHKEGPFIEGSLIVPFPSGQDTIPENVPAVIETIQRTLNHLVPNIVPPISPRAIKSARNVTLSFVLLNEDASLGAGMENWEIENALHAYIEPHTRPLEALHNFNIESQVLHHAPLKFIPAEDTQGKRWIVTDEQMKQFVNQEQWSLDSASSNDPVIRFILFVPSIVHSPMLLASSESSSFLIPQYGGVFIQNPSSYGHLLVEDMHVPFVYFAAQLQLLLGLPPIPQSLKPLSSPTNIPTAWQVRLLQRMRIAENVKEAISTLQSIADLVAKTKEMRVGKQVQEDVQRSVQALKQMDKPAATLGEVYDLSATAAHLSNRAFFNPTLVGSLYFPDEHKYAVYTPLFAPIAVPIIVAMMKEVGLLLKARRLRRAARLVVS